MQSKFLYLVFLLFCFYACQSDYQSNNNDEEKIPYDWMYNQRAYPHGQFDYATYQRAVHQTQMAKTEAVGRNNEEWELVGPLNIGGRITDIALDPSNQNVIYAGASVGGVFKSSDRGVNWTPIFDEQTALSIGNIAVAPSNPNVIYIGTGEANGSATSGAFFGNGVYKSMDAGASWQHIGLEQSQHIGRIAVSGQNDEVAYAAVAGLLYGKSEHKGLYKTTDGGNSWEKVLFISDSTSCIDVVVHPDNHDIVYAATWERIRFPWQRSYGGPTSGLHRSMDGGQTWEQLTNGLPPSNENTGRIGVSIARTNPQILMASFTNNPITNFFDGVYLSTDGGDSWARTNDANMDNLYASFGWFFGNVRIDPVNPNIAYALGLSLFKTENGGNNWFPIIGSMHVDQHGLEIHPLDNNFLVAGNDGGVYISNNGGQTWNHVEILPVTQFYHIEINEQNPEEVYGGTQDNGTIRTLTGSANDWASIFGGDGFHVLVDPIDPNFVYAESQWGNLGRSTDGGFSFNSALSGIANGDRTNWNTPVVFDPSNSATLYYGTNNLYRSIDRAQEWAQISFDLTDGQHPSGSFSFGTITTIAVAPSDSNVVYVGTDDGNVQVTSDGGFNWNNISEGLPDRYVTRLAVSYDAPTTAFVTLSGYRYTEYQPHILMTTDGGENWIDISGNLPEIPINDVIVDPEQDNTLYIANDLGIWKTWDLGETWEVLGSNFPMTVVNKLRFHAASRSLFAGTFGRSIHKIDVGDPISNTEDIEKKAFAKMEVVPNPIQDIAQIWVDLPTSQMGVLEVYNINGQLVQKISEQQFEKDQTEIQWKAGDLAKGQYFLRLQTRDRILTTKVLKQ